MSNTQLLVIALACMWIGGYATGRGRPVHCLVIWADWQFSYRPRRSARFWIAAPIVLLAAAALWTLHSRPWRNHMTSTDAVARHEPSAVQTDRRINVTLTFASDRLASTVGAAVTAAVGQALPDELIGVSWHDFVLPASGDEQDG